MLQPPVHSLAGQRHTYIDGLPHPFAVSASKPCAAAQIGRKRCRCRPASINIDFIGNIVQRGCHYTRIDLSRAIHHPSLSAAPDCLDDPYIQLATQTWWVLFAKHPKSRHRLLDPSLQGSQKNATLQTIIANQPLPDPLSPPVSPSSPSGD